MKRILLTTLALLPVTLFAQEGGAFTLKGKIGNLNDPDKLFLTYRVNNQVVSDSVTLKNGAFEFRGNVPEPLLANLTLRHGGALVRMTSNGTDGLAVYLEKGSITIAGKDSIATAIVKGSRQNDDLLRFMEKLKPISMKKVILMKEYYGAKEEQRRSEGYRKSIQQKGEAIRQEEKKTLIAFVKENPQSLVSLNALQYYANIPPVNKDEFESLFNKLSAPLKSSVYGKEIAGMIKGWKQTP
jgi:hypothetical protein